MCQVGSKPRLICESSMGDIISFDWFCPPLNNQTLCCHITGIIRFAVRGWSDICKYKKGKRMDIGWKIG